MAHGILENDNMFSVKKRPWHGLGQILENAPSIKEGIVIAGMDWEVKKEPLFFKGNLTEIEKDLPDNVKRLNSGIISTPYYATVRSDTLEPLGVVQKDYKPLQNSEAFDFFQPFLDTKEAFLESAGTLFGGKKVWVLAKINRENSVIVPGDEVEKFILLSNGHDGGTAVRVGFTPVRVVCNNTLNFAHDSGKSKLIRVMHSKKVTDNVEALREIMDAANQTFEATAEQYRALTKKQINQDDLERYVNLVLNSHKVYGKRDKLKALEDSKKDKQSNKATERIIQLFETGMGNDMKGVRGTYWAAYNAVTEYTSYERGKSTEARMDKLWFHSKNLGQYALDLAIAA